MELREVVPLPGHDYRTEQREYWPHRPHGLFGGFVVRGSAMLFDDSNHLLNYTARKSSAIPCGLRLPQFIPFTCRPPPLPYRPLKEKAEFSHAKVISTP